MTCDLIIYKGTLFNIKTVLFEFTEDDEEFDSDESEDEGTGKAKKTGTAKKTRMSVRIRFLFPFCM